MFTLKQIVPWGRSFDEYRAMFALSDVDLAGTILSSRDGPAGFNAVATRRGSKVTSCDPIYRWSAPEIEARIEDTFAEVIEQARRNQRQFAWEAIPSVEVLGRVRMAAMREFLRDYPAGMQDGRYVVAELPSLPFVEGQFDLALGGARSPFVEGSVSVLRAAGCDVSIERVRYEFQRGGNEMLRIRRTHP